MIKWKCFREVDALWDNDEGADICLGGGGVEIYEKLSNEVE